MREGRKVTAQVKSPKIKVRKITFYAPTCGLLHAATMANDDLSAGNETKRRRPRKKIIWYREYEKNHTLANEQVKISQMCMATYCKKCEKMPKCSNNTCRSFVALSAEMYCIPAVRFFGILHLVTVHGFQGIINTYQPEFVIIFKIIVPTKLIVLRTIIELQYVYV